MSIVARVLLVAVAATPAAALAENDDKRVCIEAEMEYWRSQHVIIVNGKYDMDTASSIRINTAITSAGLSLQYMIAQGCPLPAEPIRTTIGADNRLCGYDEAEAVRKGRPAESARSSPACRSVAPWYDGINQRLLDLTARLKTAK